MEIRKATIGDAAVIAEYNIALAKETESLALEPVVVRQGVEAALRDPAKGTYFGAYDGNKLTGQLMVTYEWSDWRNGNFWWLQSVYVHPDYRARSVFKSLFAHVLEQAQKTPNVCGFRLYVESHNERAKDAYQRLGIDGTAYVVRERLFPR